MFTLGAEVSRQASKFMEGCTHVQFEIIILKFILKRGVFLYFKPTRENWATQFYMGLSQLCVYIHYYRKFITAGSIHPFTDGFGTRSDKDTPTMP